MWVLVREGSLLREGPHRKRSCFERLRSCVGLGPAFAGVLLVCRALLEQASKSMPLCVFDAPNVRSLELGLACQGNMKQCPPASNCRKLQEETNAFFFNYPQHSEPPEKQSGNLQKGFPIGSLHNRWVPEKQEKTHPVEPQSKPGQMKTSKGELPQIAADICLLNSLHGSGKTTILILGFEQVTQFSPSIPCIRGFKPSLTDQLAAIGNVE